MTRWREATDATSPIGVKLSDDGDISDRALGSIGDQGILARRQRRALQHCLVWVDGDVSRTCGMGVWGKGLEPNPD